MSLDRLREGIQKLKQRSMCFELMVDFFDRAHAEHNLAGMEAAYWALVRIHRGDARCA